MLLCYVTNCVSFAKYKVDSVCGEDSVTHPIRWMDMFNWSYWFREFGPSTD